MINEYTNNEVATEKHNDSDIIEQVDFLRSAIRQEMDNKEKSAFGQFFTPYPVAEFMSSMFTDRKVRAVSLDILENLAASLGSGFLTLSVTKTFLLKFPYFSCYN